MTQQQEQQLQSSATSVMQKLELKHSAILSLVLVSIALEYNAPPTFVVLEGLHARRVGLRQSGCPSAAFRAVWIFGPGACRRAEIV